jgi:Family of unknown function (DUF6295)
MCTYVTEQAALEGSAKGPTGWFPVTTGTAYFDHPVHAQAEHTLNLDFGNPGRGPQARVAVELSARSAIELVRAIGEVFAQVPQALTGVDPDQAARLVEVARALQGGATG